MKKMIYIANVSKCPVLVHKFINKKELKAVMSFIQTIKDVIRHNPYILILIVFIFVILIWIFSIFYSQTNNLEMFIPTT